MKKLVVLIAVFFLMGCAGASLSRTSKDGATTLTIQNYFYVETIYCADGKTVCSQNSMIPSDTIMKDLFGKIMDALKSLTGVVDVPVDAVKSAVPAIIK